MNAGLGTMDTELSELELLRKENTKLTRQLRRLQETVERNNDIVQMSHDMNALRTVEQLQLEKHMSLLLENSQDIIIFLDKEGRFTYCTNKFLEDAGFENFNLIKGRHYWDVLAEFTTLEWTKRASRLFHAAIERKKSVVWQEPIDIGGKGVTWRYSLHFAPMVNNDGAVEGAMLILHDIEDVLRTKEAAEQANTAKSEFLATMSHEIRTPMNAILGMSDLMRTDNFDSVQRGYFEDIKKMSKALLEIINDILDFSKIEAGKLELVPVHFNIVSLFDNVASLCGFIAAGKSLEFRVSCDKDIPPVIYGDEIRIRQIFTNVVNNAIKYTRGGHVTFALTRGMRGEHEYLVATVEDSGIGIKAEDKSKLFGSFEQLDTRKNRSVTGTGLGLAITKQLLDLMGGFVELESVYGKGSVFTIHIPLIVGDPEQVEQEKSRSQFVRAKAGADIKILVVDDISFNLTVALGFLVRHGINADTATGGEEAVRLVTEHGAGKRYDLILMDHMMPEVDGVEATSRIRAWEAEQPERLRTPIIALSANAISGAREFFMENGMDGFISKPIVAEQFNDALFQFLPHEKLVFEEKSAEAEAQSADRSALMELAAMAAAGGMNIEEGLKNNGNDPAMYIRTLKTACKAIPKEWAKLAEECARKDWKNFGIRAHALKGIFATIGHKALSCQGKELEFAAKEGRFAVCETQAAPFIAAMEEFSAKLADFQKDEAPPPAAVGAAPPPVAELPLVREKIAALISACEASKSALIKSIFAELAQASNHASIGMIHDLIEDYEYDEAAKLLHTMEDTL
ncbi:MAG: response regulator [Spirochaetaceae bacterium]|jgi:PAS domain S-box-containing protein|nr:response regulator [Spirochaetaceae bacterium]